jgi:hypothetical protein
MGKGMKKQLAKRAKAKASKAVAESHKILSVPDSIQKGPPEWQLMRNGLLHIGAPAVTFMQ